MSSLLSSGGKFAGAFPRLAAGSADWVRKVGVDEDGNLYAEVFSRGLGIIVR